MESSKDTLFLFFFVKSLVPLDTELENIDD